MYSIYTVTYDFKSFLYNSKYVYKIFSQRFELAYREENLKLPIYSQATFPWKPSKTVDYAFLDILLEFSIFSHTLLAHVVAFHFKEKF